MLFRSHSLRQAIALNPENITVHTLTLKRASRIVIEDQKENDYADVAAMLEKCQLLADAGYRPYYLYRQKNTLQNLENVGWCKPGHEGYYNIYIMEEVQTILGRSRRQHQAGGRRWPTDAAHLQFQVSDRVYPALCGGTGAQKRSG